MERYQEHIALANALGVDGLALVPGANFTRIFQQKFHSMERALVLLVKAMGAVAAIFPNFSAHDEITQPGMVFTIESGLYDESAFGVRIEDDVLLIHEGARSLTQFGRALRIVG